MANNWRHIVIAAVAGAVGVQVGHYAWRSLGSSEAGPSPDALHRGLLAARDKILPTLPQKVDEIILHTGVRVEGVAMIYIYEVQAEFGETELKQAEDTLRQQVCSTVMNKDIAKGVTYAYEYWSMVPSKRLAGQLAISKCP